MTDSNYTHIAVVLDRSGSMHNCKTDMESGLRAFFEEQTKLPGKCLVDFVQFDDTHEVVYEDRDIAKAEAVLKPRGRTALLDALGFTITRLGDKLLKLDEANRPGTVIVVVVTDGMENASREFAVHAVRDMIKEQKNKYAWNFTFLGANIDAVKTGQLYGFSPGESLTYSQDNVAVASATLNTYVTQTRAGNSYNYTDEDRKANA